MQALASAESGSDGIVAPLAGRYPESHWQQLKRYCLGAERDPRGVFGLAEDVWEAVTYGQHPVSSNASQYRYHFEGLQSFLKPYVKQYCYDRLLGRASKGISGQDRQLPYALVRADRHCVEHHLMSLDDLSNADCFAAIWNSLLMPDMNPDGTRPRKAVQYQDATRSFWLWLSSTYGSPSVTPRVARYRRQSPNEIARDSRQVIPIAVIQQFVNRLSLHRTSRAPLNQFSHLRLCVLILLLILGRRVSEVLLAARGRGSHGPLRRTPARGTSDAALWFVFRPHKGSRDDRVYISREWEEIAAYCVAELIRYGDAVRDYADDGERGLLILISGRNGTKYVQGSMWEQSEEPHRRKRGLVKQAPAAAGALSYKTFMHWLNGSKESRGVLERWHVTADGTASAPIYHLRTHQSRHTRQTVLAADPNVSPEARQQDAGHRHLDDQLVYGHALESINETLRAKAVRGELMGEGAAHIGRLLSGHVGGAEVGSGHQTGRPQLLTPERVAWIKRNPAFFEFNKVPIGWCTLPQGPDACEEYLRCMEARKGGCIHAATDPNDLGCLKAIREESAQRRREFRESQLAGRTVQAGKRAVLAANADAFEAEAFARASEDTKKRLRQLDIEAERLGL